MTWSYITMSDSIYDGTYTNSTTTANDYFSDWTRSLTTAGTGTCVPYGQTCTVPYDNIFIGTYDNISRQESYDNISRQESYDNISRQESYYPIVQEPYRYQEHHPSEPQQQIPQKSPEQIKEEIEATERAKTLLLEYLDEDNKQKFLNKKHLEIASKLFNNVKYHIPLSRLGRIKAWKENRVITELCLLVKEIEQLPIEDVILTKLLHVMNDEKNMLKTANHSNVKENLLTGLN